MLNFHKWFNVSLKKVHVTRDSYCKSNHLMFDVLWEYPPPPPPLPFLPTTGMSPAVRTGLHMAQWGWSQGKGMGLDAHRSVLPALQHVVAAQDKSESVQIPKINSMKRKK